MKYDKNSPTKSKANHNSMGTINNSMTKGYNNITTNSNLSNRLGLSSNNIFYTRPSKPLDFSFRDISYMFDLKTAVPRKGIKKTPEEDKPDNKNVSLKAEIEEKSIETKKKKKNEAAQEIIVEGKVFGGGLADNYKTKKRIENNTLIDSNMNMEKKNSKKIHFLPYTNAIILHSNSIRSLEKIDMVLDEILPDVEFLEEKNAKFIYGSGLFPQFQYTKIDLIQWLDLSHNKLESIHPDILSLRYLKILYLHANYIQNLSGVQILSKSNALINLTLHGNPIEHIKGYRLLVIEMMPRLEKLDFTLVSEKELDIVHYKGARFGEKRDKKTGKVVEFPMIDKEILKRMNIPINEEKKDY